MNDKLRQMRDAHRTCTGCGVTHSGDLIAEFFYRDNRKRIGFVPRCKSCCKKKRKSDEIAVRHKRSYLRNKLHHAARKKARTHYAGHTFKCGVANCNDHGIDLHHIEYSMPIDVVPLCKKHHKMLHATERLDWLDRKAVASIDKWKGAVGEE